MKKQKICFLIHLPQDLDLLIPVIETAQQLGHSTQCLVYSKMIPQSPRVTHYLNSNQTKWLSINTSWRSFLQAAWIIFRSTTVMSAVETSVPPHKFGHVYTKLANKFGKKTITMQHGIENIGLTYTDDSYPINTVKFASQKILIWGDKSELHPQISNATKNKCIPFGCTKNFSVETRLEKPAPFVVGVFENLHWSRYSDTFRQQFVNDFIQTAKELTDVTFLIKPHHAGRWLTERCKTQFELPKNILVIDPKLPQWEPYTGPSIVGISDVVITTPSTIALDASTQNIPTCVAGYTLEMSTYDPLPILKNVADWKRHILAARDKSRDYTPDNQAFIKKTLYRMNCMDHFEDVL